MTVGPDGARMRAMTSADLPAVLAIENRLVHDIGEYDQPKSQG